MKFFFICLLFVIITNCSNNKGVYWCGDHPCINKKEKEAYFKKTMTVEIKDLEKNKSKKNSEIEKIIEQAKKGEKKRVKEEKIMAKQAKIEAKRKKKEEKYLAKQAKLEAKRIKKEKKKLAKEAKLEAKKNEKERKSLAKQIEIEEENIVKKKNIQSKQVINIDTGNENSVSTLTSFNKLLEKITKRNIERPYPNINDIQE